MSERSVTHATFVVERRYDASPARVFAAWADPASKARWFSCHEGYRMDFRVGGRESNRGGEPGGPVYAYEGVFHDIVAGRRIVYGYEMRADDVLVSLSLATVELVPEGSGTRLIFTDQGAYLDGYDRSGDYELGTNAALDELGAELSRAEPAAAGR